MKLKVGYVIQMNSGHLYEIKANGTYINFNHSIWLEDAEADLKNNEIAAIYKPIQEDFHG